MSETTRAPSGPTCAELLRTFDGSRSRLGAYAQWPERLKGYVAMVLEMPTPAIIHVQPAAR